MSQTKLKLIESRNVYFREARPDFWKGFISDTDIFNLTILKYTFVAYLDYRTKKWICRDCKTENLVFNYEFNSVEDIVQLISFNMRLGIKY